MNLDRVEKIADAVLYEGYILYPYRSSSVKNQQRWNFGALCPESYSQAQRGTEAWTMQTECLILGDERATFDVKVRFLHLLAREVGQLNAPLAELQEGSEPDFNIVASLEVGGQIYPTWQEATEREVGLQGLNLHELVTETKRQTFTFPADQQMEALRDAPGGEIVGVIRRRQQLIEGSIEVAAERVSERLCKVRVRILNETALEDAEAKSRDEALMRSLVSTHTVMGVREGGEFVSLLEPPEEYQEFAASCRNVGTWPVLAGEEGERDLLLSSPIILYDYPQIAPESAGDLFDGTEIDEILTLRIMTLTDEEKREMRGVDERARRILERTERLPAEQMMKLHGAMRSVHPREDNERSIKGEGSVAEIPMMPEGVEHNEWEWHLLEDKTPLDWVQSNGVPLKTGDRVILRPRKGGDIFDLALAGQIAIVEAIEQDYENKVHLAVVLEDDPGRDLGMLRQPGHRFFFSPEEVEPLTLRASEE